jgi:hypothetical protein
MTHGYVRTYGTNNTISLAPTAEYTDFQYRRNGEEESMIDKRKSERRPELTLEK